MRLKCFEWKGTAPMPPGFVAVYCRYYYSGPGTGSYCISYIDDFGPLVELKTLSHSISKLASLYFYTPCTELHTGKAATGYTAIVEFTKWYGRAAEVTEW